MKERLIVIILKTSILCFAGISFSATSILLRFLILLSALILVDVLVWYKNVYSK